VTINQTIDGNSVGTFISAQNSALNWWNHFNFNSTETTEDVNWANTVLNSFTFSNCDDSQEIKYLIALNTGHGFNDKQTESVPHNQIWESFKQY
jgi:poly(3-hydroxybutyrate) depolymerase